MSEVMGAEPVAAAELKQFIERIERLEEEKAAIRSEFHISGPFYS